MTCRGGPHGTPQESRWSRPSLDLPAEERPEFEAQGTLSIAEHPVFTRDWWWGAIGFDDCEEARTWGPAEEQALRATATLLGAAITRQRVDEQRRRAEDRWGHVVELIPAVTYSDELDSDNVVRMGFVSPQIEQILGFPPERFLEDARFWFSLMHPDDRARLEAAGAFSAEDTEPFDEEYRMRGADGAYRWVHDGSQAIYRDDGSVDYFLGFMTDITERRAAQDQLRVAEERFRTIVEQTPAVTYQDICRRRLRRRPGRNLRQPPHQGTARVHPGGVGAPASGEGHPSRRPAADRRRERSGDRRRGADLPAGLPDDRQDGRVVWFHDESVLIDDADGEPAAVARASWSTSPTRRPPSNGVREAEERHRALVEHIPAIVYAEGLDANPEDLYVSPQVERILGYTPDQWRRTADFWKLHVHPDDLAEVIEINDRVNESGATFLAEYRFRARRRGLPMAARRSGPRARRRRPAAVLAGRDAGHHRSEACPAGPSGRR